MKNPSDMKTIVKIVMLVLFPLLGFSQQGNVRFTDKFGPYSNKEDNDFSKRDFIRYPFVREADVMWSKITWEFIDLREKMNLPLYYPIDTLQGRKSLVMAIKEGIMNGKLLAFKADPIRNNVFEFDQNKIISTDTLSSNYLDSVDRQITICPPDTFPQLWKPEEITQILVKEVWYVNRKTSQLNCEIIGLCLIREYRKYLGCPTEKGFPKDTIPRMNPLLWIYYPESREYLATIPVYNPYNSTESYSFDDLFVNRRFRSYFVREANVYNNRNITQYATGFEAQKESEGIKKEIFDYEQDLWEN
jgi:gliding motility associated protien GldN